MSRSFRHTPKRGVTTCRSEKAAKKQCHRLIRRRKCESTQELRKIRTDIQHPWGMPKDGKYIFDPDKDPHLMRK